MPKHQPPSPSPNIAAQQPDRQCGTHKAPMQKRGQSLGNVQNGGKTPPCWKYFCEQCAIENGSGTHSVALHGLA
jgi:hypothetical protein